MTWTDRLAWMTRKAKSPKSTFIFPTSIGLSLIAIALFSLVAGMIYANNLVLILGLLFFILIGFCSIITNFHLDALPEIQVVFKDFHFGDNQTLSINTTEEHSVELKSLQLKIFYQDNKLTPQLFYPSKRSQQHQFTFKTDTFLPRGEYQVLFIEISTSYPLGLFRAWRILKLNDKLFIYPKRIIQTQLSFAKQNLNNQKAIIEGVDEYNGHERSALYQISNRTDWKRFFSNHQVWNKKFKSFDTNKYKIDLDLIKKNDVKREDILSIICGEIFYLSHGNQKWLLKSDSETIDSNLKESLRLLAKW